MPPLKNIVGISTYHYSYLYVYSILNLPVVSFLPPQTPLTVVAATTSIIPTIVSRNITPSPVVSPPMRRDVSTTCSVNSALFTCATRDEDTVLVLILWHRHNTSDRSYRRKKRNKWHQRICYTDEVFSWAKKKKKEQPATPIDSLFTLRTTVKNFKPADQHFIKTKVFSLLSDVEHNILQTKMLERIFLRNVHAHCQVHHLLRPFSQFHPPQVLDKVNIITHTKYHLSSLTLPYCLTMRIQVMWPAYKNVALVLGLYV